MSKTQEELHAELFGSSDSSDEDKDEQQPQKQPVISEKTTPSLEDGGGESQGGNEREREMRSGREYCFVLEDGWMDDR